MANHAIYLVIFHWVVGILYYIFKRGKWSVLLCAHNFFLNLKCGGHILCCPPQAEKWGGDISYAVPLRLKSGGGTFPMLSPSGWKVGGDISYAVPLRLKSEGGHFLCCPPQAEKWGGASLLSPTDRRPLSTYMNYQYLLKTNMGVSFLLITAVLLGKNLSKLCQTENLPQHKMQTLPWYIHSKEFRNSAWWVTWTSAFGCATQSKWPFTSLELKQ